MRTRAARGVPAGVLACAAAVAAAPGCGHARLDDPNTALRAYADAAAKGDSDALFAMLDERDRRSLGREGVRRAVVDGRRELGERAAEIRSAPPAIEASAEVKYADGEVATLALEQGVFRVSSADALPAAARTPAAALDQLRRVLARRSYAGLLRVLSSDTRAAIERDLRALVDGLERPETLNVEIRGDRAAVKLGGGHSVRLRREAGRWQVDDFD